MAITPTRAMITNRPERIIKGFQRTVIGLISLEARGTAPRGSGGTPETRPSRSCCGPATRGVGNPVGAVDQWVTSTGRKLVDVGAAVIGSRGERATPSALFTSKRGRNPLPLRHSVRAERQDRVS